MAEYESCPECGHTNVTCPDCGSTHVTPLEPVEGRPDDIRAQIVEADDGWERVYQDVCWECGWTQTKRVTVEVVDEDAGRAGNE